MASAGEIFWWIIIFVVGSLIVSFILNPGSIDSIIEPVKNTFKQSTIDSTNTVKVIPSQMEEYSIMGTFYKECTTIEALGEAQGMYDLKDKACREACGKRNMDSHSYDCEKNLFVCYCVLE